MKSFLVEWMSQLFYNMIHESVWYCWVKTVKTLMNPFFYFLINLIFLFYIFIAEYFFPEKTILYVHWEESMVHPSLSAPISKFKIFWWASISFFFWTCFSFFLRLFHFSIWFICLLRLRMLVTMNRLKRKNWCYIS